jgi:hypothetical protein
MIRGILFFLAFWAVLHIGVELFWKLKVKEKVALAKTLGYSLSMAAVALWFVVGIVYIF